MVNLEKFLKVKLMDRPDLNFEKLAHQCKIAPSTMTAILKRNDIKVSQLETIANTLNVSVHDFFKEGYQTGPNTIQVAEEPSPEYNVYKVKCEHMEKEIALLEKLVAQYEEKLK